MMLVGLTDTKENPVLFTTWSVMHFLSGAAASAVLLLFTDNQKTVVVLANFLHILYELFDVLGSYTDWFKPFHDSVYSVLNVYSDTPALWSNSLLNSVGDLFSFALGQLFFLKLFAKHKVAVLLLCTILFIVILNTSFLMKLD